MINPSIPSSVLCYVYTGGTVVGVTCAETDAQGSRTRMIVHSVVQLVDI